MCPLFVTSTKAQRSNTLRLFVHILTIIKSQIKWGILGNRHGFFQTMMAWDRFLELFPRLNHQGQSDGGTKPSKTLLLTCHHSLYYPEVTERLPANRGHNQDGPNMSPPSSRMIPDSKISKIGALIWIQSLNSWIISGSYQVLTRGGWSSQKLFV